MAQANRHFIPGHIWHLAHRCHNGEFLLKFSRDRKNDHDRLRRFLNTGTNEALAQTHRRWIESQLKMKPVHEEHFSRSITVGSEDFIERVKKALVGRAAGKRMLEAPAAGNHLKDPASECRAPTLAKWNQNIRP